MGVVMVWVTCPRRHARRLAAEAVRRSVAACVNLVPVRSSVFRWKGRVRTAAEELLILKTTRAGYRRLERMLREHHPYECPEILATPVVAGFPAYLRWVRGEVKP